MLIATAFVAYYQKENIARIKNGTESKFLAAFLGKNKNKDKKDESATPDDENKED